MVVNRSFLLNFLLILFIIVSIFFITTCVIPVKYFIFKQYIDVDKMHKKVSNIDVSKNPFLNCTKDLKNFENCGKPIVLQMLIAGKYSGSSIEKIYDKLNELLDTRDLNEARCHDLSHDIGRDVNAYYKNERISLRFAPYKDKQNFLCANGFAHGVMGNTFDGLKRQNEMLRKLAVEIQNPDSKFSKNVYIGGMHEIGHYALQNNADAKVATKMCSEISVSREYELSCYTGVYMEVFAQMKQVGIPIPLNYCNDFSGLQGISCEYVANRSTKYLEDHSQDILNYCNSITDEKMHYACNRRFVMESFGKNSRYAYSNSYKFCMNQNSKDFKISCLYLLSFDVQRYYPDIQKDDLNLQLCSGFSYFDFKTCSKKLATPFSGNMYFRLPEDIDLKK